MSNPSNDRALALANLDQRIQEALEFLRDNDREVAYIAAKLAEIDFPERRLRAMGLLFTAKPRLIPVLAQALLVLGLDSYAQSQLTRLETP